MKVKDHCTVFRYSVVLLALTGFFGASGCKKSGEANSSPINSFKRYAYERAHFTYEYDGDLRGTEELFVSGYGKDEARYSRFEVFSEEGIRPVDNCTITRIADMYVLDRIEKSYFHEHRSSFDSLYHLDGNEIPSAQEYLESELKKNLMKNTGTEMVNGKLASKWEGIEGGITLWVWNSVMLRKQVSSPKGWMSLTIKSIDSLWTVDTTKFVIPDGFILKDKQENAPASN